MFRKGLILHVCECVCVGVSISGPFYTQSVIRIVASQGTASSLADVHMSMQGYNGPQVLNGKLNNTKVFSYVSDLHT